MPRNKNEPDFKTVFYKQVELFLHRDNTEKPMKLRLYDAASGFFVASEISKAEADRLGLPHPVRGKNEEELLLILENRVKAVLKIGESFKDLLSRSRSNASIGEKQKALVKAYAKAKAASSYAGSKIQPAPRPEPTNAPVVTKSTEVALVGDQSPRKEPVKMPEIQNRKCSLVLHCGASAVQRVDVARVSTPTPTDTWSPIPHVTLIEEVESAMRSTGLRIGNQVHSLNQEGAQYFGLTEVFGPVSADDYSLIVGIRNSHNKTFPVGLVAGATVFVCDNLSFSGDVRLTRKHTVHLQRDLPQLVSRGVGKLMDLWGHQGKRIDAYKNHRMRDKAAHDLVIRAVDLGAATNRMIPAIVKEWREPTYPDFSERSAWSLFNAFTEVLKGNLPELPKRTEALHALFDTHVGLPAAHLN